MLKIKIKLKEVLKKRNLTQKQLETMSGVSQARISKLAKDDRQEVNLDMLTKIATALDIKDISELIQFEEVPDIDHSPNSH